MTNAENAIKDSIHTDSIVWIDCREVPEELGHVINELSLLSAGSTRYEGEEDGTVTYEYWGGRKATTGEWRVHVVGPDTDVRPPEYVDTAYDYARSSQGFVGTFEDFCTLAPEERREYENGAAGLPSE